MRPTDMVTPADMKRSVWKRQQLPTCAWTPAILRHTITAAAVLSVIKCCDNALEKIKKNVQVARAFEDSPFVELRQNDARYLA